MVIFWIPYLLFGSITCSPVPKAHGPQAAVVAVSEPVEVPLPYSPGANPAARDHDIPFPYHHGTNMAAADHDIPFPYHHGTNTAAADHDIPFPYHRGTNTVAADHDIPFPYHPGTNMAGGRHQSPQAAATASAPASEPVEVPLPYHLGSWKRWVSANRGNTAGPASAHAGSYSGNNMAAGSVKRPQAAPMAVSEPVEVPLPYHSGTNMAGGSEFNSGYAGYRVGAPEHGGYASAHASGYGGSAPSGSYDGSARGYAGSSSYGYVSHQDGAISGSDGNAGPEAPEPVYSDVSDLDPVYSFSSRSSYQRGRAMFAQTHYSPGEPAPHVMPVDKLVRKTSTESGPAAAPAKGGF